jgi:hypothetical protein
MDERPPSPHDPDGPDRPTDPGSAPGPAFEPPPYGLPPPPGPSTYGAPPPGPPPEPPPIPWEQPGLDFFSAFYESLRLLVSKPRQAFERVGVTSAVGRPLGFALLVGWPGILAATLWDLALQQTMEGWMPWTGDSRWERSPGIEIAVALAAPLWLPLVLLVGAAIQHAFLWMVGGARRGFVGTFRVMCYAQASSLLGLIPACGGLLSLVWHLVLAVIGFSAVHRITTGRSLFAVLLPVVLCCGCLLLLMSLFGAAWLAAMSGS